MHSCFQVFVGDRIIFQFIAVWKLELELWFWRSQRAPEFKYNVDIIASTAYTFVSDQQSLITGNSAGNFVTRSVGQMLSSTLSNSLNNWLQRLLKTDAVNLYTNINTSDFNFEKGATQTQLRNLGNLGFKTSFYKGRLLLNLGGNFDYRVIQTSTNPNSSFLFTPDVSFEYLITPDGKFRVVGFNRTDEGIGGIAGINRRNRTGLLVSYRKDFDTFGELFRKN